MKSMMDLNFEFRDAESKETVVLILGVGAADHGWSLLQPYLHGYHLLLPHLITFQS